MYNKIIIVDDDNIKADKIKTYLENGGRKFAITRFTTARDIMLYFRENKDNDFSDTLLLLDWCFPFRPGDYISKSGDLVLHDIKKYGINIDTVIVSSDIVEVSNASFVKGSIRYNSSYNQQEDFDKFLE
jgi:hypothetical protein